MIDLFTQVAVDPALVGAFDVGAFLKNSTTTVKGWGGLLLTLIGAIGVIAAGVMLVLKFWFNSLQQWGWGKIIVGLLVSGMVFAGGFKLVSDIASGGKQTIEDLGNGKTSGDALLQILTLLS